MEEANENDDESGETPDKPDDEDHEMEVETLPEPDTAAMSSSSRGEKRTETQENVFVKRRLMAKLPKRPITLVPPPEDPVKRRLLKKTDMRNDELVMNVRERLMNVVSMLTKDENMPEKNSNEDNEMPKLTVLDDYEEMMKGRQNELNSLKEMCTMTIVKRSEAVGKRTIQTRWVDREKDGRVKSRLVLKDCNRCQGRTQPEMFSPTPSTLSLKTLLAAAHTTETMIWSRTHITVSIDVHTAFLHAMSTKTCLQNRQNQMSTERRRSVEIEQSTVRISQCSKIVASTPRECPGKSELSPTPDGPKLFPKR